MKKCFLLFSIIICLMGFNSCMNPVDENLVDGSYVYNDPAYAEGLLLKGYTALNNQYSFTCVATDDAASNKTMNDLKRMATGELTANYNPISRWEKYEQIFYINKFLSIIDGVTWKKDTNQNVLFYRRLKGEALALRALYHFYILEAHAGKDVSGNLLGIPYYKEFIEPTGNFNLPRLTFSETIDAINEDFNEAFNLLPYIYSDNPADIPEKDKIYDTNAYLTVNGSRYKQRMNGQIVKAMQARLELFAASPSYLNGSGHYELAAKKAADLLAEKGFELAPDGVEFYNEDNDKDNPEILWRGGVGDGSWLEQAQFPPSLNGGGEVNPSQNLVDAFPMKDGFPINESIFYNENEPYSNRDPRLAKFIVYNGNTLGNNTISINTSSELDGLNNVFEKSTRTGYYLKKLLRTDVIIPNSGTPSVKQHFDVYMRYTELFLILAEAQNAIGGPDYKIEGSNLSARDILRKIRSRALEIDSDPYLEGINDKYEFTKLLQNERRLELCFEGFRFWDLRRWGLKLDETIKGISNNGINYSLIEVEPRVYEGDKYYYMPIPYNEVLKFDALIQNAGW